MTGGLVVDPSSDIFRPVSHEAANLQKTRAAPLQSPFSKCRNTNRTRFGHFVFFD
jgi:hypothetical protein